MNDRVRYFDEINILRAIATLAVISIHVSGDFSKIATENFLMTAYMAVKSFSSFAVPLFICISGFVLYNKYSGTIALKNFYEKRLFSLLPPYFVFSTFYLVIPYIISIVLAKPVNLDIPHIVYQYATGGCSYHLWFFVLIIQFYLVYPAIIWMYRYCDSRDRSIEFLFGAFLVGFFYNVYPVPDVLGVAPIFLGYLFYFVLGMIVRSRYEELTLKPLTKTSFYCMSVPLLCGTIFGTFNFAQEFYAFDKAKILPVSGPYWGWFTAMITPLFFVVMFAFCLGLSLQIISRNRTTFILMEKIGHYSFGIYLVHAFVLYMIVLVFSSFGFDWNNWLFYPLTFCLTLILSILSVEVIQQLPYSRFIIGSTR
ncbi:acyltransferase [Methanosphaerula subterraneus]|uniref:acyltransferase n=1 Tax=Methanosphaerula subterraneus TaxID=3350244 RepID=UPI003F845548